MEQKLNNNKPTWTAEARQARLTIIKDEIRKKKKMTREELIKFALNSFELSLQVINNYIKELRLNGFIEIQSADLSDLSKWDEQYKLDPALKDVIIWKGNGNEA